MHIGFIMDGNRRWAKNNMLKSLDGHKRGLGQFETIVQDCIDRDVQFASFWALAKKNILERSEEELNYLYKLIEEMIEHFRVKAHEKDLRFAWIGNPKILPESIVRLVNDCQEETKNHQGMTVIVAIGYGGQDEIVEGVRSCLEQGIDPTMLDEGQFSKFLPSGKFPPPDLIIRTGGTMRTSGYWLYGSEYSEWYFSDKYWPEFDAQELDKALEQFSGAIRNFGK